MSIGSSPCGISTVRCALGHYPVTAGGVEHDASDFSPRGNSRFQKAAMQHQMGRAMLEPGQWVRHPGQPGWGLGQVQSVVGDRVTVNFENAGKILVNTRVIALEVVEA
jgi:Protein of unknown function (DUF3553)